MCNELERTDTISLSLLFFSYRCASFSVIDRYKWGKKGLFAAWRMFERTMSRLIYERSFHRDVLTIGQKLWGVISAWMNLAWLDFSIRFNAPFNACTRRKIITRIINVAVIKTHRTRAGLRLTIIMYSVRSAEAFNTHTTEWSTSILVSSSW